MKRIVISLGTALAVFAAGAAALVYQVAFARYLTRFVGSDHVAAGLTLGVFLGGLALGSLVFGRWSFRVQRHLPVYAALELAVGAWALLFPFFVDRIAGAVESWRFTRPWGLVVQGLAVSAVLVLPPTMIMGGTVPFLTRGLARVVGQVSSLHAALYAANTAGAFAGALLAGFALVPRYGLPATVRGTAIVNLGVAGWFGALALRRVAPRGLAGLRVRLLPAARRYSSRRVYAMGLLNGLAVLMLETTLMRFAALLLGGSVYAFALVVAAFVLALAAGSVAISKLAELRTGLLWRCQVAAGVYLLLLYSVIDVLPYYAHLLRVGFQPGPSGFALYYGAVFAALFALILVPVGLLGTTLPLLFHELRAGIVDSGRLSGTLLAWNGLGALAGALAGAFALYEWLDLPRVYLLAVAIVFGNAVLAARHAGRASRLVAAAALVAVALVALRPWYDADRLAVGVYRVREPLAYTWHGRRTFFEQRAAGYTVVAHDDDGVGSVAVLEHPPIAPGESNARSLAVNGRPESNTVADAVTLRLSAHIPALWAPDRGRTLLVGMGTGVTAGELALYDDVRAIDVAEISPAVIRFLPFFADFTSAVDRDPRLRVRLGDATLILRQTPERWNLVVSEPSHPWTAGADALFAREFYRQVSERLTDDGLFLQWVQLYESDFEILGIVLNTLRETFPVIHAFRGSRGDLLLLAAKRPFATEDRLRAERALAAQPRVAASLAGIGIHSLVDILEREVQTLPIVIEQARRYGVHTANHPRLLYLAGEAMFSGSEVTDDMLRYGITDLGPLFDQP